MARTIERQQEKRHQEPFPAEAQNGTELARSTGFGDLVRAVRERAKLTQTELGRRLNLSQSAIARIESGDTKFPRDAAFYQALREIGVTDFEMKLLLRSSGAAASLVEEVLEPRCVVVTTLGISIPIFADPDRFDQQDIDELKQLVTWACDDFERRRTRRLADR